MCLPYWKLTAMPMGFVLLSLISMTLLSQARRRYSTQKNTDLPCAEAPSTFKMTK
jgi:hypothetical protein